jgi:Protein of unknown function DUF262
VIEFSLASLRNSSVASLYRLRDTIEIDPIYQRQGEVWSKTKQRLLIDSIINQFDIPKIYFHEHTRPFDRDGRRIRYSLVDGRQRLEAIWDFIDGRFALDSGFRLLEDNSDEAAGMTYAEIEEHLPELATLLSTTPLDVVLIRTDDIELIEEMFSRLNEAVPLNAPEKRNGRGGPLRATVRTLSQKAFFSRLPFSDRRFRHLDLATKFLYWVEQEGPADTKKRQLDEFWDSIRQSPDGDTRAQQLLAATEPIVDAMAGTFTDDDPLLASIGMVSVYFLLYRERVSAAQALPTRNQLEAFDQMRRLDLYDEEDEQERYGDEDDLTDAQFRLLEFDRLTQSPNDGGALRYRLNVLRDYLENPDQFSS